MTESEKDRRARRTIEQLSRQCRDHRERAERLEVQRDALLAFARRGIEDVAWAGGYWEGPDIQDDAVDLGLIRQVPFDPDVHTDVDLAAHFEPGDLIYEFTELMRGEP